MFHYLIATFFIILPVFLVAEINFSVTEPFGRTRSAEPVSGGLAFKKGEVKSLSQLALFREGIEIPAQFTPLVRYEDGSCQWLLADFTDNLPALATQNYTVRNQAPSVSPSPSISVTRAGSVITLDNGVLRMSIDTVNFQGIQSLLYNGDSMLSGTGGISAREVIHGATTANGPVTRAGFVYLGSLRATYRVEGDLFRDSCGGLGYSYLITAYAGVPWVSLQTSIRNTINASCGRMAKIRFANASFNLAYDPSSTVSFDTVVKYRNGNYTTSYSGDTLRSTRAYSKASGRGLFVTERWAGGLYPNYLTRTLLSGRKIDVELVRQRDTSLGIFYKDSVHLLQDLAQKTSEIILACYDGALSAGGIRDLVYRAKGRLVPKQDAAQLSSSGGMSAGLFGTLADEDAAYAKWGWTVPASPLKQSIPDAQTDACSRLGLLTHADSETDPAHAYLLQWARMGGRGLFDFGEAWSRFYRDHFVWRSTGWEFDGFMLASGGARARSTRTRQLVGGEPGFDNTRCDMSDWSGCHFYGMGLPDYYCLTGDPDALDAVIDLGEMAKAWNYPTDTTNPSVPIIDRKWARQFGFMVRRYSVTRDSVWLGYLKTQARRMARSTTLDPWCYAFNYHETWSGAWNNLRDGLVQPPALLDYLKENRLQAFAGGGYGMMRDSVTDETWRIRSGISWVSTYIAPSLDEYVRIFGDEDLRDLLIGFGQAVKWLLADNCRQVPYNGVLVDYPRKGMFITGLGTTQWDSAHAGCYTNHSTVAGTVPSHGAHYSRLFPSALALAYRHSGYSYLLEESRVLWDRGSKQGTGRFLAPENEVYMYSRFGENTHDISEYKHDYVSNANHLFYEAVRHIDTIPPEKVTNLSVARLAGNTGLLFSWTAPAGAAEYQVKYFKGKPIAEYPDLSYKTPDSTRVPWWYARNVGGEPAPATPGAPESFSLTGVFPDSEVYYAALCSRDSAGNLSPLSNLVVVDSNTISVERGESPAGGWALTARPNPFNPAVSLTIEAPAAVKEVLSLKIFNLSGRLVQRFEGTPKNGRFSVSWRGEDLKGAQVASGVYIVKLNSGNLQKVRQIILSR